MARCSSPYCTTPSVPPLVRHPWHTTPATPAPVACAAHMWRTWPIHCSPTSAVAPGIITQGTHRLDLRDTRDRGMCRLQGRARLLTHTPTDPRAPNNLPTRALGTPSQSTPLLLIGLMHCRTVGGPCWGVASRSALRTAPADTDLWDITVRQLVVSAASLPTTSASRGQKNCGACGSQWATCTAHNDTIFVGNAGAVAVQTSCGGWPGVAVTQQPLDACAGADGHCAGKSARPCTGAHRCR